jgi:HD-GYP domain-containing protein (c-di-GMP phosphodiesterase class II)/putative methionine-R-sulfoxide reductase with GAF domain
MAAKARGKNQSVLFDDTATERPGVNGREDVRSIAHLKMLQSLAGRLNRLNDVREIGSVIVNELRGLIDYHNCRVYIADGDTLFPIAFKGTLGQYTEESAEDLACKFGEGFTGWVAETGRSLLLANAMDCEFAVTIPNTEDIDESVVAVPLKYGSRVSGAVVISKLGVSQFDEDDVRLLEVLAGHASVALENARLYEAERKEAELAKESLWIANALLDFSREVATVEGMDDVLERIVDLTAHSLGSPRVSVWMEDVAGGDLAPCAFSGYSDELRAQTEALSYSHSLSSTFLSASEPFTMNPEQLSAIDGVPEPDGVYAVAPLHFEGARVGCIVAMDTQGFTPRTMRLFAGLAHQAKLAIQNAGAYDNLEETFFTTVEALANALEANDEYTSSHARWITDMALDVGRELGLDSVALKRLELGALFHDIGKIGISSTILLKPGPLTKQERAVMETHPELGERILAPIARLEAVRPIVRHCHERWDGKGYPDALGGRDIPIESRVIFVCDAFHAMTTDRPYRRAMSLEDACKELEGGAGSQFDPDVVAAFLRLAPSALATHPL